MELVRSLTSLALILALAGTAAAQTADPAAAPASPAQPLAEKRVALVIGNGQYTRLPAVPNAAASARRVADALRQAGFEVEEAVDLERLELERLVRRFGTQVAQAQIGAFYYAGRSGRTSGGLCMEPVDAPARQGRELAFECVPLTAIQSQLERETAVHLVFWDSELGRNAPPGTPPVGTARTRAGVGSGAAVLFAAQVGETIRNPEAAGRASYFAEAIAEAVTSPGLDVVDVLRQVRYDVRAATGGAQTPWFRIGVQQELALVARPPAPPPPPPPAPPPVVAAPAAPPEDPRASPSFSLAWQTRTPPPDPTALELAAWNSIVTMRSDGARRAGLIEFLQRFPTGQYASLARIHLDDLERPAAPAVGQPPDPLTLELAEWSTVQVLAAAQKRAGLQAYLDRHPNGRFAALARLQMLEISEPPAPPQPPAVAANDAGPRTPPASAAPATPPAAPPAAPAAAPAAPAAPAAAAAPAQTRFVVVRRVNLRAEPNPDARLVRGLEPWTIVTLRNRTAGNQWVEVQIGNERGFLLAGNIRDLREAEEDEWARIRESRERATFETFLRRFPNGAYATEATRRRDQLARAPAPRPAAPAEAPAE